MTLTKCQAPLSTRILWGLPPAQANIPYLGTKNKEYSIKNPKPTPFMAFLEFCKKCLSIPSCEQTNVWKLLVPEIPLSIKAILHLDNHGSQKSNA
jgi:hypothetical protein